MAYDEKLAGRLRNALIAVSNLEEQHKMGGVSFMVNGKMCVRAHSDGNMMLRCAPEKTEELLLRKGVKRYAVKGKPPMNGWLLISSEGFLAAKDFDFWIGHALEYNKKAKAAPKRRR